MKRKRVKLFISIISALFVALLSISGIFYSADSFLTDCLYNRGLVTTDKIIIIGVDEETLSDYGNFNTWARQGTAQLIDKLYADPECAPAVVGVDFLFVDELDDTADDALVNAVNDHDNLVFAANLVYRGTLKQASDSELYYDPANIEAIEEPYEELGEKVQSGYTNALIAKDGFVRYSSNEVDFEGRTVPSFSYAIYQTYCEKNGFEADTVKTNSAGQFQFFFSGKTGQFSKISFADVLNGDIPATAFRDRIVLIGSYAPGFQDAYQVAVDRGDPMNGVEIHANMIQALIKGKTATPISKVLLGLITFIFSVSFLYLGSKNKLSITLFLSLGYSILICVFGMILAKKGSVFPLFYCLLFLLLADAYFIIEKYVLERLRRKKTISVFKQYVAPKVVDQFMAGGDFEVRLGGEKRDIAVLFVDIRGFTPLSESLPPETVVSILNRYLGHITSCVFAHDGTIDKFIGDAAMAVFNAPFDQEDYIYAAVATAWDIAMGAAELEEALEKEFGKKVRFGVGVNCGEAVVGNIGCDFRMDYTAIGDTVNTAARLESNAGPGQILISKAVYDALEGRIEAISIGEIPLKGKSTKIEVFSVTAIH